MLTTLEIRWFKPGLLPSQVQHWFDGECLGDLLTEMEVREDEYLYLPQHTSLNVKRREEKLEIKMLQAELGLWPPNLKSDLFFWQGQVERWQKWSGDDPIPANLNLIIEKNEEPWIVVQKERQQRTYRGVHCEISQLNVKSSSWWSIALEMAEGEDQSLAEFREAMGELQRTYREPVLLMSDSHSYPIWLQLVISPNVE